VSEREKEKEKMKQNEKEKTNYHLAVVNGVRVFRPLLTHNKRQIFDYAHTYGVPYFKDTTPSWSTRGKCRNLLLPLLTDIFGEGFLSNLSNLAFESDAARDLLNSSVVKPFTDLSTHFPATQSLAISASNFKVSERASLVADERVRSD